MKFFVKAAFWIALILFLLPSNGQERYELYATAQRTISDIGGFCTRNPDICEKASSAFQGILQKLKAATHSVEDVLYESGIGAKRSPAHDEVSVRDDDPPYHRAALHPATTSSVGVGADTLTAEDKRPTWRGPNRI